MKAWNVVLGVAFVAVAGPARAQEQAALLDLSAVDPDVPPSTLKQLSEGVRAELAKATPLLPPAKVDDLRSGAEPAPDIAAALEALQAGKAAMQKFQYKPAAAKFADARRQLQPVLLKLRDYQPLTDSLLYLAVASTNLNDAKIADAAFAELARIRPDFKIDPAQFPPAIQQGFEKARQAQAKIPRGRLALNSEPTGAKIFVDELPQGVTPANIAVSPGVHAVRVTNDGYFSWTESMKVVSYEKSDKLAKLEPNTGSQALRQLEAEALAGGAPGPLARSAAKVASALGARAVVAGAAGRGVEGFVITLGYLPAGAGSPYFVAAEVKRDLSDLSAVGGEMAKVISEAARGKSELGADGKPVVRTLGAEPPTRPLDFAKHNLGIVPGPLPPELLAPRLRDGDFVAGSAGGGSVKEKKSSTWWIWTVGAVVVAGIAGGTTYYFLSQPNPPPQFTLQRQ